MGFWDTVLATFLANVAAVLVLAIPILTTWKILTDRDHRLRGFLSLRLRRLWLWVRFNLLVVVRKRRKSEYRSWYRSVAVRNYHTRLLSEAPKVRAKMMAETLEVMQRIGSTYDQMLLASPDSALREAVGRMSLSDWETPVEANFASMSPLQRAKWLNSQTTAVLAKWSVRLEPDERHE